MSKTAREEMHSALRKWLGKIKEGDPTPPLKKCTMRCGHEEVIEAGVDPAETDCWICMRKSS